MGAGPALPQCQGERALNPQPSKHSPVVTEGPTQSPHPFHNVSWFLCGNGDSCAHRHQRRRQSHHPQTPTPSVMKMQPQTKEERAKKREKRGPSNKNHFPFRGRSWEAPSLGHIPHQLPEDNGVRGFGRMAEVSTGVQDGDRAEPAALKVFQPITQQCVWLYLKHCSTGGFTRQGAQKNSGVRKVL